MWQSLAVDQDRLFLQHERSTSYSQVEQSNSRSTLPNKLRHPCRHLKESLVDSGLDLVVSRCIICVACEDAQFI